jgi:hypothetical protein
MEKFRYVYEPVLDLWKSYVNEILVFPFLLGVATARNFP